MRMIIDQAVCYIDCVFLKMNTTQIVSRERSIFFPKLHSPSNASDPNRIPDNGSATDVEGKVKNRLVSMWNNVKFGKNCLDGKCLLCFVTFSSFRHETADELLEGISRMAAGQVLSAHREPLVRHHRNGHRRGRLPEPERSW